MKLKMCRTQSVLALLALYVGLAQSWDIAVSYRDELKFYTNGTLISTTRFKSQSLTSLAYDDVRNRILYVDRQTNGDAVCGYSLCSVENKCFTERTGRKIHGIAFDSSTETIFFTDTNDRTVNTFSLKSGSQNNARGNLLIKIDEGIPRDIIVDSCRRYVYWITTDKPQSTIERARFTGAGREVFRTLYSLHNNPPCQFEPHSLTFNPETEKIYWYEPWSSTEYRVYSSSVLDKNVKSYNLRMPLGSYTGCIHPSNTLAVSNRLFFLMDFRYTGVSLYAFRKDHLNPQENHFLNIKDTSETVVYNTVDMMTPVGIVGNYQITEQDQVCEIF